MSDTRDRMWDAARAVAAILPPGTGFVVLAFDFDKPGKGPSGRLEYVSNAKRTDICRAMLEFVEKTPVVLDSTRRSDYLPPRWNFPSRSAR